MPLSCLENDLLIETLSGSFLLEHQKGQTGQKVHNVFSPDFQGTFWVFVVNLLDHCSNGRLLRLGMQCHTYSLDLINEGLGSLIFFIFQLRLLFTPDCKSCLTTDNQEVNKDFPTCTRFFSTISSPLQKANKTFFPSSFPESKPVPIINNGSGSSFKTSSSTSPLRSLPAMLFSLQLVLPALCLLWASSSSTWRCSTQTATTITTPPSTHARPKTRRRRRPKHLLNALLPSPPTPVRTFNS